MRLHPLTAHELKVANFNDWDHLFQFSGFPEPFLSRSEVEVRRWSREYRSRFLRDDLSSLERIEDITLLEQTMLRLPGLVGSPLSINNLRNDLQVSHRALSHWLQIFERLYAIYRISPIGGIKIQALKKAQKHYHYDWTLVKDPGPRFENMVGNNLLAHVQYHEDTQGRDVELRYYRDSEKREVDFVITEDQKPRLLIECKTGDEAISPHLHYLKSKFPKAEAWQLSHHGSKDYVSDTGIRVTPAWKMLSQEIEI